MKLTEKFYCMRALLSLMILITLAAVPAHAGGRREGAGRAEKGDLLSESAREVEIFLLTEERAGGAAGNKLPGSEAAYFLFQSFSRSGNTVRITSHREFSMPIRGRETVRIDDSLYASSYTVELSPKASLSYSIVKTVRLDFEVSALVSGSGRTTQPAGYAAIQALEESGMKEGLVRVRSLSLGRNGKFTGLVELAEEVPRKK